MSKPKTPNQKHKYSELTKRLAQYVALVQSIYDTLNLEAAKLVESLGISEIDLKDRPFSFSEYPETQKRISDIQRRFVNDIGAVIYHGTSEEWKNSNEVQNLFANAVLKTYNATVDKGKYKVLYPWAIRAAAKVILRVTKFSPRRSLSWLNRMPFTANIP